MGAKRKPESEALSPEPNTRKLGAGETPSTKPISKDFGARVKYGKWNGEPRSAGSRYVIELERPDDVIILQGETEPIGLLKRMLEMAQPVLDESTKLGVDPASFVDEFSSFLSGYVARLNEDNPPRLPSRKFTPRQDRIVDFLLEVWGEWLERGLLTKPLLKEHDPKAYDALMNYQRANELPSELQLPTQREANDLFLERGYFTAQEAQRVVGLLTRRQ